MKNIMSMGIALGAGLLVSACGGGGDSGPGNPGGDTPAENSPAPIPTAPVDLGQLDDASAQDISTYIYSIGGIGVHSFGNTGANTGMAMASAAPSDFVAQAVGGPHITFDCPNGGTATWPEDLGLGTYTFVNCQLFQVGPVLDGSVFQDGNLSENAFDGWWTYTNFTVADPDGTLTYNGTLYGKENTAANITTSQYATQNGMLIVAINSPSFNDEFTLQKLTMKNVEDLASALIQYDFNFVLSSQYVGGTVTIKTNETFQQYLSEQTPYPFDGQYEIFGLNNSAMRITALGGNGTPSDPVLFERDYDGDGVYDTSQQMTWAELDI